MKRCPVNTGSGNRDNQLNGVVVLATRLLGTMTQKITQTVQLEYQDAYKEQRPTTKINLTAYIVVIIYINTLSRNENKNQQQINGVRSS